MYAPPQAPYNAIGRRAGIIREDGSQRGWDYNARGEVVGGAKVSSGAQPEPGLAFGYAFDAIGNRTASTISSAISAALPHVTTHSTNALNQYTARSNPGVAVARGVVHEEASLAVNGGEPELLRSGQRWVWERGVGNAAGPAWQAVNVSATRTGAGPGGGDVTTARTGAIYVPPAAEALAHDADGNLTSDGRWSYSWDAENRLVTMETQPALVSAGAPRQRLEFGYDARHRRIRKAVQKWDDASGSFQVQSTTTFIYDGWNLIAELDATPSSNSNLPSPRLRASYEWGLDLSGTMTGAGGVGGLLVIRSHSSSTVNNGQPPPTNVHTPCYDGNGNIMALVNLTTGQTEARYDYGPFGERVLAAGGEIAEANPFRFSTKFEDSETGLLYYGYRFYDPIAGRWVNRDPIGEAGGLNLNGMVDNDPLNWVDTLGLAPCQKCMEFTCEMMCAEQCANDHCKLGFVTEQQCWSPCREWKRNNCPDEDDEENDSGGNACRDFVDSLVSASRQAKGQSMPKVALGTSLLTHSRLARQIASQRGLPNARHLPTSGFRPDLVSGGQNGQVYQHAWGAAGLRVLADSGNAAALYGLYRQHARDHQDAQGNNGHDPAEGRTEVRDNIAGERAGRWMSDFLDGKMSDKQLAAGLRAIFCENK